MRAASLVEYLIVVAIGLCLVTGGVALFSGSLGETFGREGQCVRDLGGCDGGGAAAGAGALAPGMGSATAADATPAPASKGFWGAAKDVATGLVVDGLWGTITGVATALAHPVDTVTGIATAVAHPIDTAEAIREGVVTAWNENPERFVGAVLFEVVSAPVAATKAAKVAKAADKVGDAKMVVAVARRANNPVCGGGVCMRPGACFGPGTLVATPDGDKPIETLAAGDVVLARDPETWVTGPRRVAQLFITPEREVLDLGLEREDGTVETLTVTPEHPFWREGSGFVAVSALQPGDAVRTAEGLARVVSLATLPDRITVYNFEVEAAHTYFVGTTAAWVHNACQMPTGGPSDDFTALLGKDVRSRSDALADAADVVKKDANPFEGLVTGDRVDPARVAAAKESLIAHVNGQLAEVGPRVTAAVEARNRALEKLRTAVDTRFMGEAQVRAEAARLDAAYADLKDAVAKQYAAIAERKELQHQLDVLAWEDSQRSLEAALARKAQLQPYADEAELIRDLQGKGDGWQDKAKRDEWNALQKKITQSSTAKPMRVLLDRSTEAELDGALKAGKDGLGKRYDALNDQLVNRLGKPPIAEPEAVSTFGDLMKQPSSSARGPGPRGGK